MAPKVTAYLECGCAILENGSRVRCPSCEAPHHTVYDSIQEERIRQEQKWGGSDTDDQWQPFDWYSMIADYNAWARRKWAMGNLVEARRRLVQVAALAVAAVEVLDRRLSDVT